MRTLFTVVSVALLSSCGSDDSPNGSAGGDGSGGTSAGRSGMTGGSSKGGSKAGADGGGMSEGGAPTAGTSTGGAGAGSDVDTWSIDASFGENGFATLGSRLSNDLVTAVQRQNDGQVLVAGTDHPSLDQNGQVSGNVLVARLDAAGALDEGFGSGGIVRVPIGYRAQADTLEVQADGNVVVVGQAHTAVANGAGLLQPFVLRLLANGQLDVSFGDQGVVLLSNVATFSGSALQADGKILAVGSGSGQLQMIRLNAEGELDPTFGTNGLVSQLGDATVGSLVARDITTTSSGEIVVVGQTTKDLGDVLIARYLSDGSPDDSFGMNGRVVTPLGTQYDIANAVAIDSDDGILVAGRATDTSQPCGAFGCLPGGVVLRYDSEGELDPAFGGGDGWAMVGEELSELSQLAVVNEGRLVVAGAGQLVTLLSNGTPDDTFGAAGLVTSYNFQRAAIGPDGDVVVVGRAEDQAAKQAELLAARIDASGEADTDYGVDGWARFGSGGIADMALNVVEDTQRRLLVLGTTQYFYPLLTTFAVSRLADDGSLDTSFGDQGFSTLKAMVHGAELLHTPEGKTLAVGTSVPSSTWFFGVHRLNADGLHDDSFGTAGIAEEALIAQGSSHARAAALQGDGKLVVVGYVAASNNFDLAVLRLDTEGLPDDSFGTDGHVVVDAGVQFEQLRDVALTSAGEIVAVGGGGVQGSTVLLGRWSSDGAPDETFGDEGLVTQMWGGGGVFLDDLALQADGKILVAGYRRAPTGLVVARFLEDGTLDPSFADAGIFLDEGVEVVPFGNWLRGPELLVLDDGSILVAGTRNPAHQEGPVLLQLSPDGALSVAGSAETRGAWTAFGATSLSDGNVVTVGRGFSEMGGTDYGLIKFTR